MTTTLSDTPTATPLGLRLLGLLTLVGAVLGTALGFVSSLAALGMLLGIASAIGAVVVLVKSRKHSGPKLLVVAALALGLVATVVGSINAEEGEVVVTTVNGEEGVGTSAGSAAAVGDTISAAGWTVTVDEVTTVEKDQLGQAGENYSDLLQVRVTASYDGPIDDGEMVAVVLSYESPGGTSVGNDGFSVKDAFPTGKLMKPGDTVSGNFLFDYPETPWNAGHLVISPATLGSDVYIALK